MHSPGVLEELRGWCGEMERLGAVFIKSFPAVAPVWDVPRLDGGRDGGEDGTFGPGKG